MKYYINDKPKKDFYLLGNLSPTGFTKGHGIKFILAYLDEFPFLVDEVFVIDELDQIISFHEFFKKVKDYDSN